MPVSKTNVPVVLLRLKAVLVADRRKTVVLGVVLAVALVLTIRLLLGRNMPKRAVADPAAQTALVPPSAAPAAWAARGAPLPDKLVNADTAITRDLFKVSLGAYPVVVAARSAETGKMTRLQLQSIMPGPRPTAIVNGLVVGVGDTVKERVGERWADTGFVVVGIEDKACVVTQQGVSVRLEMKDR